MIDHKDPDLERYDLTAEQVAAIEGLFVAALAEAGYPTELIPGEGYAVSSCPDDVWVRACNIARCAVSVDQFPDVDTWRRWANR